MKDRRTHLLRRLSRRSFRYRTPEMKTTIAGGGLDSVTLTHRKSTALMQEVITVETATNDQVPEQKSAVVMAYKFQGNEPPHAITLTDVPDLISAGDQDVWIDLAQYSTEDLNSIADVLKLNPIGVNAALSAWKRPRLDAFSSQFLVTATIPSLEVNPYRVVVHQLDLFVGERFLLSVHQQALPFAERILARSAMSAEYATQHATFLLYITLDELLAYYEELNALIQVQIENMEERALTDTSDHFLVELLHFKRYAFALSQIVDQHRPVFAAFLRPDFHHIPQEEVTIYYRDLEARFARLADILLAAKESMNGIFDIYVSHVSHRTNKVMKILTMVSTVLLPSTVILGFFSTNNVTVIPFFTHTIGFSIMVISIVSVSSAILWRFRRQGWL